MMRRSRILRRRAPYTRSEEGIAAVEFAIWTALLVPVVVSAIDLGMYAYDKIQVANAGQTAVQAAWAYWYANCSAQTTTTGCDAVSPSGSFTNAVKYAITQSSNLGVSAPSSVTRGSASVTEGTYCANTSGQLATSGCPTGWTSGYYYALTVTYTYHPLFSGASVTGLLPGTISQTSWVRLK